MKNFLTVFSITILLLNHSLGENGFAVITANAAEVAPKKKLQKTEPTNDIDRGLTVVDKNRDSRRRVALVIGNSNYRSSPLKNPANDAHAMASSLRRLGFDVDEKTDLGYIEMNKSIENFGKKLRNGGVGLFYYAGHGMQVNGANYLIPVDGQIEDENEVRFKAVDAGLVLAKMEQAKSDVNLVVLDACRDNPFSRSFRSISHGLASMDAPSGTFIAYATAPGKTAADGTGKNGLYTAELVKVLETPGIPLEQVFKRTLKAVREKSGNKQTPWVASNLEGEFYFIQPSSMTDLQSSDYRPHLIAPVQAAAPVQLKQVVSRDELPESASRGLTDPITGMQFIKVPSGCFRMGDTSENGSKDESPAHEVCLDEFAIGKFEVTQGQWKQVMGNNPSEFSSCGDDCPVEMVRYFDVKEFINKLNSLSNRNYRLPTEAEWEYACRSAGKNETYCGGDISDTVGWIYSSEGKTHVVGQKKSNELLIYDMSGNVSEWVQDRYNSKYYETSQRNNPEGPTSGSDRVYRGGSFKGDLLNKDKYGGMRATSRNKQGTSYLASDLGFRLVSPTP